MSKSTGITTEQLEALCSGWPGVSSDVKWGDERVYSVANKMFVLTRNAPGPAKSLFFKVPDERFLELTDQPGILPAPYLARHHWVLIDQPQRFVRAELERFIYDSYLLVRAKLPKKIQAGLVPLPTLPTRAK